MSASFAAQFMGIDVSDHDPSRWSAEGQGVILDHHDDRRLEVSGKERRTSHTLMFDVGILGVATTTAHDPTMAAPGRLLSWSSKEADLMPVRMTFAILSDDDFGNNTHITFGALSANATGLTIDRSQNQLLLPDYGEGPTGYRVGHADWETHDFHNKPTDACEPGIFDMDGHAETNSGMTRWCNSPSVLASAPFPRTGFSRAIANSFVVPTGSTKA